MKSQYPQIVEKISQAVSVKLGRSATVRKVKNHETYFILDLAFSYFQKADRNRRNDYRSGYVFFKDEEGENCLMFGVSHAPIMFSFLKQNFDYSIFRQLLEDTAKFRKGHYNTIKIKNKGEVLRIVEKDIHDFLIKVDKIEEKGFAKTAFAKNNSSESGIGNIFSLGIARGFSEDDVDEIIDSTWDLFMWLYPSKPLFNRDASLSRSLKKIEKQCEIKSIKKLPKYIKSLPCCGQIEGAHIKPHKLGGSDKLENGLWLCNVHHKLTEGKIFGQRSLTGIDVQYINNEEQ